MGATWLSSLGWPSWPWESPAGAMQQCESSEVLAATAQLLLQNLSPPPFAVTFFLSDFCPLGESPSFPFPVPSELRAALLQPSLLPKYSPERSSVGLRHFLPAISFPPVILPSQPCLALVAHPTLCLAGAAPEWGARQPHQSSPPSRGASLQLSAASPSPRSLLSLLWFGGSQCSWC